MKHIILMLGFLSLPGAVFADVDKEELKKLFHAGLSDDLILSYARSKGPVAKLSADDVVELKKAGLSDGLLANLLRLSEPTPNPVPATTSAAVQRLLSDPDIVYDGRYFSRGPISRRATRATVPPPSGSASPPSMPIPAWCAPRYGWSAYSRYGGRSSRNCYR